MENILDLTVFFEIIRLDVAIVRLEVIQKVRSSWRGEEGVLKNRTKTNRGRGVELIFAL